MISPGRCEHRAARVVAPGRKKCVQCGLPVDRASYLRAVHDDDDRARAALDAQRARMWHALRHQGTPPAAGSGLWDALVRADRTAAMDAMNAYTRSRLRPPTPIEQIDLREPANAEAYAALTNSDPDVQRRAMDATMEFVRTRLQGGHFMYQARSNIEAAAADESATPTPPAAPPQDRMNDFIRARMRETDFMSQVRADIAADAAGQAESGRDAAAQYATALGRTNDFVRALLREMPFRPIEPISFAELGRQVDADVPYLVNGPVGPPAAPETNANLNALCAAIENSPGLGVYDTRRTFPLEFVAYTDPGAAGIPAALVARADYGGPSGPAHSVPYAVHEIFPGEYAAYADPVFTPIAGPLAALGAPPANADIAPSAPPEDVPERTPNW